MLLFIPMIVVIIVLLMNFKNKREADARLTSVIVVRSPLIIQENPLRIPQRLNI
jgi:signal transduction histidine kinase